MILSTLEPNEIDILIVDDTPVNLRLLSDMLEERHYNVRKALNGNMALLATDRKLPHLILLDVNMPDMNGYQVCQQLKKSETTRHIPVIFISALDEARDKIKAFQAGGVDYVTKPFAVEEVLARINHQLELQRLNTDLRDRNQELEDALTQLKLTQAQLIQKEKMSSLAELVSGVAHQINNPVSFIYSNLEPANEYINSLLNIIAFYQEHYPDALQDAENPLQELDFDFLESDLRDLMQSMYHGADRIRSIVLTLQKFSHLDEAEIKWLGINQELESTLTLIQYDLESRNIQPIKWVKSYGDIPDIMGCPRDLNQVFLNLFNNAIEALEDAKESVDPTVWIETKLVDEDRVQILIKNNGVGVSEEIRSQIFDPFFTTKLDRNSQGLGLSISHQIIVEQHGGCLICESLPGAQTAFIIELPIQGEMEQSSPKNDKEV
ncbi:sensor histidine kinase [Roseofilum capinflatum]|uniref:histidine kinase n=1 Tax=Roseofilum capinflatum BLCC-M114 TaxID=3022440 RepID=A0ABT7BA21_9CYAN|nr:response regulator [Roseofilum capinflatum]MDJ1175356.1 response regulator [Roseofilum capinflatum BLCC-M114]